MKKLLLFSLAALTALILAACGQSESHQETHETTAGETATATSAEAAETYPITGTIVSRNEAKNEIRTDHDEIPGFMKAMEMSYEVRGAKVAELPADGSRFRGTLHVSDDGYWLTDVTAEPAQ